MLLEYDPGWLQEMVATHYRFLTEDEGFQVTESTQYAVFLARPGMRVRFTWDWRDNAFDLCFAGASPDAEMITDSRLINYFERPVFDYAAFMNRPEEPMGPMSDNLPGWSAKTQSYFSRIAAFFQPRGYPARLQELKQWEAVESAALQRQIDDYEKAQEEKYRAGGDK